MWMDSTAWLFYELIRLVFWVFYVVIVKLRLEFAAIYIALICTVWSGWERAHPNLAMFFFAVILALTVASWIYSLVCFVRDL